MSNSSKSLKNSSSYESETSYSSDSNTE